jgi:hypothetical protein
VPSKTCRALDPGLTLALHVFVNFRTLLVGVAVSLIVAFFCLRFVEPLVRVDLPAAVVEAPPLVGALSDAGAPEHIAPSEPAPTALTFSDGFCAPQGAEAFEVSLTLPRLLTLELRRRRGADAGDVEETALLLEALTGEKQEAVLIRAKQLTARLPDSPFPQVVVALVAEALDLPDDRVQALRRARQLLPSDGAIGVALAQATRNTADLDEAIDGLSSYLAAEPSEGASRLRARLAVQRDIQHAYRRVVREGITVLWPGEIIADREADELASLVSKGLDEAAAFTATRRRHRLTVIVYPSRSELLAVSCVRAWSAGLFDGSLRVVFEPGQGIDQTLVRHETLHAQLSMQPAPKWFHEGVAMAFAQQTFPRATWYLMVNNNSWIPFRSLEESFQVFSASADAELAYAQSYAMVEVMRELGGDRSIPVALQALQSGADTPTAIARACGRPEFTGADLIQFLDRRLAKLRAATGP